MIDDHNLKPNLTFTATHKDDNFGRESILRYIKATDMALAINAILSNDRICEKCRNEIIEILEDYTIHIEELIS